MFSRSATALSSQGSARLLVGIAACVGPALLASESAPSPLRVKNNMSNPRYVNTSRRDVERVAEQAGDQRELATPVFRHEPRSRRRDRPRGVRRAVAETANRWRC